MKKELINLYSEIHNCHICPKMDKIKLQRNIESVDENSTVLPWKFTDNFSLIYTPLRFVVFLKYSEKHVSKFICFFSKGKRLKKSEYSLL